MIPQVYDGTSTIVEIFRVFKTRGLTYNNHFGNIPNARKAAGIYIKPVKFSFSDKELFDELKRLTALLGRKPKPVDIKKYGKYSLATYYYRFGSYAKAYKAAGII